MKVIKQEKICLWWYKHQQWNYYSDKGDDTFENNYENANADKDDASDKRDNKMTMTLSLNRSLIPLIILFSISSFIH